MNVDLVGCVFAFCFCFLGGNGACLGDALCVFGVGGGVLWQRRLIRFLLLLFGGCGYFFGVDSVFLTKALDSFVFFLRGWILFSVELKSFWSWTCDFLALVFKGGPFFWA